MGTRWGIQHVLTGRWQEHPDSGKGGRNREGRQAGRQVGNVRIGTRYLF